MKQLKDTIFEAIVKKPRTTEYNPSTPEEKWLDKCKDFCMSGAWQWTNGLRPSDFDEFIIDARKFDISSWPCKFNRWREEWELGYELAMAMLNNKSKKEIINIYNSYNGNNTGAYWFQSFGYRPKSEVNTKYCYLIEALLLIANSLYHGQKNNYWYGDSVTPEKFAQWF